MANYSGITRTNYFRVTDEEKYKEIIDKIDCECGLSFWEKTDEKGVKRHGFGGYGSLYSYDEETGDDMLDDVLESLTEVLPEDEAIIITEIGNEKLRYLVGQSIVITRSMIQFVDLRSVTMATARSMLENPDFVTQLDY